MKKIYLLCIGACLSFGAIAQTYTFTNATATGPTGPTQVQIDAEYLATNLNGQVTINTQGVQEWTVPASGTYHIETYGAQGGSSGGQGAYMSGDFTLVAGEVLKIVVGQEGGIAPNDVGNGGGGGSFVTLLVNTPLCIAGGGAGTGHNSSNAGYAMIGGTTAANGQDGQSTGAGLGGIAGNGGFESYTTGNGTDNGGGGCGLLTDGGSSGNSFGGSAFVNGCEGGAITGGFGGGGGTNLFIYGCGSSPHGGSGGGGYSGGGAGGSNCNGAGGGGGSFNSGTNQVNTSATNTGNGLVVITSLCSPSLGTLVADLATLPDVTEDCVATPTAPTASNDCNNGLSGTPDVTFPITTIGTTVVTWTYDDGVNIVNQSQNVIITGVDITPPVVNNPNLPDLGGQCNLTPPYPTATDFCAGLITGVPDVTFPMFGQGLTVITWSFDDGSGNITTQTQNITLNDVAPPALDIPNLPDYTGCNSATPPTATATDYCAGALNGTPDVTFPITAAGPTTVTWTYDDGNGNVVSQTQDVYVNTLNLGVTLTGTTITADQAGLVYQWINCTTNQDIAGETNQSYTPVLTGNYAVLITDIGCTDTSACSLVDFTGIEELSTGPKELMKIIDFMGRETQFVPNTPLIYIYSDGTRERILILE